MTRPTIGLLLTLILSLLVAPLAADVQQPTHVPRIGMVSGGGDPRVWTMEIDAMPPGGFAKAFRQGLRDLGYIEGKNILIEYRTAEGHLDRIPGLVAELVQLKVDVLVSGNGPAIRAAKEAITTVPIVMVYNADPVATGIVESLARPGGNITGFTTLTRDLRGKRLELLMEVVPGISRVGVLGDANEGEWWVTALKEYEAAARSRYHCNPSKYGVRTLIWRAPFTPLQKDRFRVVDAQHQVNIAFGHVLLEKAADSFGTLGWHFYTSSATWERRALSIATSNLAKVSVTYMAS